MGAGPRATGKRGRIVQRVQVRAVVVQDDGVELQEGGRGGGDLLQAGQGHRQQKEEGGADGGGARRPAAGRPGSTWLAPPGLPADAAAGLQFGAAADEEAKKIAKKFKVEDTPKVFLVFAGHYTSYDGEFTK